MRQLALVAFYREKPAALGQLIQSCQEQLQRSLGSAFQPYELAQVHATILGLERIGDGLGHNYNFANLRGEQRTMDLAGLLDFIGTTDRLPFTVQFGGFADRAYPFTSRGRKPYARSFVIQGDKAVLMGWPVDSLAKGRAAYPHTLDELRRQGQAFNVLHKYHQTDNDVDNDLYLRLGLLETTAVPAALLATVSADLRGYLSIRQPLRATVGADELSLIAYADERLPPATTRSWPLDHPDLTPAFLQQICQE
jgi:hypothetical protein